MIRTTPLHVQFVITSLPVGGAEVLLYNMLRRMDRQAFEPEVVCLKEAGELGEAIAAEVPLHCNLLHHKWDVTILPRLASLYRRRKADAVITIGAGDKMFWGRMAAKLAAVPVICSALHSTGWPDGVGRLNRLLTPITDGFIACANGHAEHLVEREKFPRHRVFMIPNGVDTNRFQPCEVARQEVRRELQIEQDAPVIGIVAALRDEKNHEQFVEAAGLISREYPKSHFVVVGDGPCRATIEAKIAERGLTHRFSMLGSRRDTDRILAALDVFALTSRNEANPVSILEAFACGVPVVAPNVGSIAETVIADCSGYLTVPLSAESTAKAIAELLADPVKRLSYGLAGRSLVRSNWSLDAMVTGYENLMIHLYNAKAKASGTTPWGRVYEQKSFTDNGTLIMDRDKSNRQSIGSC